MNGKKIKIGEISGLTKDEEMVLQCIAYACEHYNKLPIQHPTDMAEWNFGIHICQGLLMQRSARRSYPKQWYNQENDEFLKKKKKNGSGNLQKN